MRLATSTWWSPFPSFPDYGSSLILVAYNEQDGGAHIRLRMVHGTRDAG